MVELSITFCPQDDVKNLPKMVHSEGIKVENQKICSDATPCALNLEFFVKAWSRNLVIYQQKHQWGFEKDTPEKHPNSKGRARMKTKPCQTLLELIFALKKAIIVPSWKVYSSRAT